jgi:hypothetical protein
VEVACSYLHGKIWLRPATSDIANARIIALELEASNVELLRRNTEAVRNITVKAGALWPRKASLSFVGAGF